MKKISQIILGSTTCLMVSSSFGHAGHTTMLFHNHEGTATAIAALSLAGIVTAAAYLLTQRTNREGKSRARAGTD
ncbi:MAG: hypothetical protein R3208_18425 [Ketobacteraceae bacterium]|nr:hypothetical protein [Ketobacteraceae bacterium]